MTRLTATQGVERPVYSHIGRTWLLFVAPVQLMLCIAFLPVLSKHCLTTTFEVSSCKLS